MKQFFKTPSATRSISIQRSSKAYKFSRCNHDNLVDSLAKRFRENELNRNLRARNSRSVAFLEATSCQLLYYTDVFLEHSVKGIVVHVRGNDLLNGSNHRLMENLIDTFKDGRAYGVNEVFLSSIMYNKRIKLPLLEIKSSLWSSS